MCEDGRLNVSVVPEEHGWEGDVFLRLPDFLAPWLERFKGFVSAALKKDAGGERILDQAQKYLGQGLALLLVGVVWVQEIFLSWMKSLSFDELRRFPPEDWTGYMKKYVLPPVLLFFVLLAIFSYAFSPSAPVSEEREDIYVTVHSGMSADDVADMLEKRGIIRSRLRFWLTAKMNGADSSFKVGTYAFHTNMEPRDVLLALVEGQTVQLRFTIPEGFTVEDIAKRLDAKGIVRGDDFLRAAKHYAPYDYIEKSDQARYYAEGFLFPDTYEVDGDVTVDGILSMMSRDFDQRLTPKMRERAKEENLSIYELIILASLVEKEARYAEDRALIAQVFLKRLAIGMPLQSDATLQYLLDAPKEDVTYKDTEMDSPYNTYQYQGLPPGPVANPGTASIEAVLWPANTDYLYFVADREGHNYYSYTYAEHDAIVQKVR